MSGRKLERVWFFSPAIATAIFFGLQLILAFTSGKQEPSALATAQVEAPKSTNIKVRVVEQIRAVDVGREEVNRVPETEAQLMRLFDRDGAVIFFNDEVDVVETQAQRFDAEEVGVITLRKGRFVR